MGRKAARQYKHNRLQQLRGFCHAARTGSVSKAAEALNLSQPSVSLQIQALERELGVTLFERRGPRIKLTPDGRALYEIAASLVDGIDSLHHTFRTRREGLESGRLDIAAGESTILYILPEFIRRFSAAHPGVELHLHNVTGQQGLEMLRADKVDFAVGSLIDVPKDILYLPAFEYHPRLITPLDHPLARKKRVTLKDVSQYPLILPPRNLTTWRMVDLAFQEHHLTYDVKLEAGGWEVIKKYVELGLGISIVTSVCLTGREKLAAMPLDRYLPARSYGAVVRRGRYLAPPAVQFIALMKPDFDRSAARRAALEMSKHKKGIAPGGRAPAGATSRPAQESSAASASEPD